MVSLPRQLALQAGRDAALKAFRTAELGEMILVLLDKRDIHAAICSFKAFKQAYDGSAKLQTLAFTASNAHQPFVDDIGVGAAALGQAGMKGSFNPSLVSSKVKHFRGQVDQYFTTANLLPIGELVQSHIQVSHSDEKAFIVFTCPMKADSEDPFGIHGSHSEEYFMYPLLPIKLVMHFNVEDDQDRSRFVVSLQIQACTKRTLLKIGNALWRFKPILDQERATRSRPRGVFRGPVSEEDTKTVLRDGGLTEEEMGLCESPVTYVSYPPIWRVGGF